MQDEIMKNVLIPTSLHTRTKLIAIHYRVGLSELVTKILTVQIDDLEKKINNKEIN